MSNKRRAAPPKKAAAVINMRKSTPKTGGMKLSKPKAAAGLAASRSNTKSGLQPVSLRTMPAQTGGQRREKEHEHEKGMAREYDPETADSSLKKKSPWYASLRDPIQGGGAKIPDVVGINTATMQLVQRQAVPVNAGGCCGLEVVSPYINLSSGGQNYRITDSTATSTSIVWIPAVNFSNSGSMQTVAQSHRVVSAAIYAEYEGTTLQDSGDVTCYIRPYTINALNNINQIQTLYGSSVIPVNKARTKPVVSRWFPVNYNDKSYEDFLAPNFNSFGAGACTYWTLGLFYQGLPAGLGSVIFTIVVNYEFVPALNTIDFITPDPSPIDPIEEQMVQQWVQEDTQTGLSSNKLVDVQPGSQVVEAAQQGINADSGFGMLGSIIKELAPVILPMFL